MPIYAYKCESCGFAKDVLQKLSDSQLTQCPTCGASAFKKQLTAAGFQLKGSGWYATDFKGSAAPAGAAADASAPAKPAADGAAQTAAPAKADSPAASATGGCGGGCACH
ncbi:MAG: FmdB family zinc ribbon protein [Comamonadaceae bacterium]